jgi:hypothetical protein
MSYERGTATQTAYIFKKEIVSNFIGMIVRLSPMLNELPDLNKIADELLHWLDKNIPASAEVAGGMYGMSTEELESLCSRAVHEIKIIENLNLSKAERENGIEVNDPSRPPFVGSSRYDKIKEEHDFIDLGALSRNVYMSLMNKE